MVFAEHILSQIAVENPLTTPHDLGLITSVAAKDEVMSFSAFESGSNSHEKVD